MHGTGSMRFGGDKQDARVVVGPRLARGRRLNLRFRTRLCNMYLGSAPPRDSLTRAFREAARGHGDLVLHPPPSPASHLTPQESSADRGWRLCSRSAAVTRCEDASEP
ncbi:hypothetical protein ACRRTK_007938 [Alexandromys fortis]